MRIAAAALGWRLVLIDSIGDDTISAFLGLNREEDFGQAEREEPELLVLVTPQAPPLVCRLNSESNKPTSINSNVLWRGKANILSPKHEIDWPVIDEVARATQRLGPASITEDLSGFPNPKELFRNPVRQSMLTAERAVLGRRSAVAMDGSTTISREKFFCLLARLVPTHEKSSMPWDTISWRPRIHLGLFVHRVDGLSAGLYVLVRDPEKLAILKAVMNDNFIWQSIPDCPPGLPLYLLQEGDYRTTASHISCGQDIAADGAFSMGMIADFKSSITKHGAAFYKNLFWEAGMVGQVLYLEAEEAGLRATGIGCYFDDPVHEVFGISSHEWQSFYHFTVGGPVEDTRLTTLPAYGH